MLDWSLMSRKRYVDVIGETASPASTKIGRAGNTQ